MSQKQTSRRAGLAPEMTQVLKTKEAASGTRPLTATRGRMGRPTTDGRHNTAFTLIELVIVLAIIGLVAAMTVPGFVGMMRGRHLTSAANLVHAALTGTKNFAVTQRKPYGLVFDISEGKMGIYQDGDTSNPLQGKEIFLAQVVSFDTGDADWRPTPTNGTKSLEYELINFNPDGSLTSVILRYDDNSSEESSSAPVIVIADRQGEHMYIRVVKNTGQAIIE